MNKEIYDKLNAYAERLHAAGNTRAAVMAAVAAGALKITGFNAAGEPILVTANSEAKWEDQPRWAILGRHYDRIDFIKVWEVQAPTATAAIAIAKAEFGDLHAEYKAAEIPK